MAFLSPFLIVLVLGFLLGHAAGSTATGTPSSYMVTYKYVGSSCAGIVYQMDVTYGGICLSSGVAGAGGSIGSSKTEYSSPYDIRRTTRYLTAESMVFQSSSNCVGSYFTSKASYVKGLQGQVLSLVCASETVSNSPLMAITSTPVEVLSPTGLTLTYYYDSKCADSPVGKTVYTTNQCFSDGTRSTKLICSSLSCVQNAYSNTDCSGAESSVLATYPLNTPCVQTSSPTLFPYVKQTLSVGLPSPLPSAAPSPPTAAPSARTTSMPSLAPVALTTVAPSARTTSMPSLAPVALTTVAPSARTTSMPSLAEPAKVPNSLPSAVPFARPTERSGIPHSNSVYPTVEVAQVQTKYLQANMSNDRPGIQFLGPVVFSNLAGGQTWYLEISVAGTGWQSRRPDNRPASMSPTPRRTITPSANKSPSPTTIPTIRQTMITFAPFKTTKSTDGNDNEDEGKGKGNGRDNNNGKENEDEGKSRFIPSGEKVSTEEREKKGQPSKEQIEKNIEESHPSYVSFYFKGRHDFPLTKFCKPQNTCAATGGLQLSSCLQNFKITPDMLDKSGSIVMHVGLQTFVTGCQYRHNDSRSDLFIQYTLRKSAPAPVSPPTAMPTQKDKVYPVVVINMNVTGLAADAVITPDVQLAFKSAMHTTLNATTNVPALNDTEVVLISTPEIVVYNPVPVANLTVPPVTLGNETIVSSSGGTDDSVTPTRKLVASTEGGAVANVQIAVTLSAPETTTSNQASKQTTAVENLVNEFFSGNLNYTLSSMGLGLDLKVSTMSTQVSNVPLSNGENPTAPPSTNSLQKSSNSEESSGKSNISIIAGSIAGLSVVAGVVYYLLRQRNMKRTALAAQDETMLHEQYQQRQSQQRQQWSSQQRGAPSLPLRNSQQSPWDRGSNDVKDDIPSARLQISTGYTRSSTIPITGNPMSSRQPHDQL